MQKPVLEKGGAEGIESNINSCTKALQVIKRTLEFAPPEKAEAYFSQDHIRGMQSEISVRKINFPSFETAFEDYMKMFAGLRQVIKIAHMEHFNDVFFELEDFMKKDYNIIVRAYLCNSMFVDGSTFFGKFPIADLLKSSWQKLGLTENKINMMTDRSRHAYDMYMERVTETLLKLILSASQNISFFFARYSRTYDLSLFLHESHNIDKELDDRLPCFMTTAYAVALPICIMRLEYGFTMEIYSQQDYCAVFMWMNQFYDLYYKNLSMFVQLVDPQAQAAIKSGKFLKEACQNLSAEDQRVLVQHSVTKAKFTYSEAMFQIFAWMLDKGYIKVYGNKQDLDIRYARVFRMFDDCIFCKSFDYEYYCQKREAFLSVEIGKSFVQIKRNLDTARKQLGKFMGVFDGDVNDYINKFVRVSKIVFLGAL